jgi:hypothetical protein
MSAPALSAGQSDPSSQSKILASLTPQRFHVAAVFAVDPGGGWLGPGLDPTHDSLQAFLASGQPFLMTR